MSDEEAVPAPPSGDTAARSRNDDDADSRPRDRDRGAGRRLRVLTGVDEDILDCIPSERTRYSALASVMIGTACFSGVSMFFALAEVMGSVNGWFLLLAIGWAAFILCLDRWLVSSSSGTRWRSRTTVLIPRFVVAVFIGFLIAEPLVLRIFQPTIEQKVRSDRAAAIRQLTSDLMACNPVPGVDPVPSARLDCSSLGLGIKISPGADTANLNALLSQQSNLKNTVEQETSQLAALENTVNAECNGVGGPGLTGKVGNGPACQQDEQDVAAYRASHPIDAQNSELSQLTVKIANATNTRTDDQAAFAKARAAGIAGQVASLPQPGGKIGLGDRFEALLALSRTSGIIGVTSILLRLFFVLVDCLPVLLKFFGGATAYDRLADREVASAERIFERAAAANETAAELRIETELHNLRADEERKRSEATITRRNQAIEVERNQLLEVDKLWAAKRARRKHAADAGAATVEDAPLVQPPPTSTRLNGYPKVPHQIPAPDQLSEAEPNPRSR